MGREMDRGRRSESGFTLIELLMVVATLFVLTGLSFQIYHLYLTRAYNSGADIMLGDVQAALEAGRIEDALINPPGWKQVTIDAPGAVSPEMQEWLPNLINRSQITINVERNGLCEMGLAGDWCITEWIDVRHCRGDLWKSRARWRNGLEQRWEWAAGGGC